MSVVRYRPRANLLLVAVALLMASCTGAREVCSPSDPLCGGGGSGGGNTPTVSVIAVTSPIVATVMAMGRTAQLSASASDASGNPITVTFSWTSANMSTATVSSSGLVAAIGVGTTSVQASANGVTGSLTMRVVDADLDGVASTLGDSFVAAIRGGLTSATASTLSGFLSSCSTHINTGNVLAIDACLQGAQDTNGADGTDDALLAVLALFLEHAQRNLQL